MTDRARSFGAAAEAYERYRPGYPPEVVDVVEGYAGRPLRTALEIGAGTGKATRVFAAHGIAVTATDPDPQMLEVLRDAVPGNVRTVRAALEDLRPGPTYDLVYAAAALHWTRTEGRWARVAGLLVPGGVFASFGGPYELGDRDLADRVAAARAPFLETDDVPSPDGTDPAAALQWPGTELERSADFEDVRQSVLERRLSLSAEDVMGHLSTVSAYLQLPPDVRRQAFDAVREELPPTVEVTADLTVHLACRRRDRSPMAHGSPRA